MSDLPTHEENKELENLFLAVFFNDLGKVIEFKKEFPEIYSKKTRFELFSGHTFNLINLTLFHQIIWDQNGWKDYIMPFITRNRLRTTKMLDFWREELDCRELSMDRPYNYYHDFFYCNDPKNTNEISGDPITDYLEKGYREIDLKLYNRAESFDFEETEKLLKQGARINIHFEEDGFSSTLDRIACECSFLTTCNIIPLFEQFEKKGYFENFIVEQILGDLLGLAAHEEMFQLLMQYNEEQNPQPNAKN